MTDPHQKHKGHSGRRVQPDHRQPMPQEHTQPPADDDHHDHHDGHGGHGDHAGHGVDMFRTPFWIQQMGDERVQARAWPHARSGATAEEDS